MIRNIFQLPWAYLIHPFTHFLDHEATWDINQVVWVVAHCPVKHFCVFKSWGTGPRPPLYFSKALPHISFALIWSGTSPSRHGFISTALPHILHVLRWSGTCYMAYGLFCTALSHIPRVSRWSGTPSIAYGSFLMASLHILCVLKELVQIPITMTLFQHIPCILRWSETYIREYGFLHTAELHILSVLCSSGTIHKNPGSHSTAVSSAARGPRASFICFIGWKKKNSRFIWSL